MLIFLGGADVPTSAARDSSAKVALRLQHCGAHSRSSGPRTCPVRLLNAPGRPTTPVGRSHLRRGALRGEAARSSTPHMRCQRWVGLGGSQHSWQHKLRKLLTRAAKLYLFSKGKAFHSRFICWKRVSLWKPPGTAPACPTAKLHLIIIHGSLCLFLHFSWTFELSSPGMMANLSLTAQQGRSFFYAIASIASLLCVWQTYEHCKTIGASSGLRAVDIAVAMIVASEAVVWFLGWIKNTQYKQKGAMSCVLSLAT
jgi:hypothetical protein